MRAAILTVSDKGSRGQRIDESGPALAQWLTARGVEIATTSMVADEQPLIAKTLIHWSEVQPSESPSPEVPSSEVQRLEPQRPDSAAIDLILTTGGTGLSPRDVTPEATVQILDRLVPGFAEAMRAASLAKTPYAMLSRAICGIRNRTLIINLPGSPAGAIENLEAIWPAIPHAIKKLQGDPEDCVQK